MKCVDIASGIHDRFEQMLLEDTDDYNFIRNGVRPHTGMGRIESTCLLGQMEFYLQD